MIRLWTWSVVIFSIIPFIFSDIHAEDVMDIDDDGHTGLPEAIYSLQVVAGIAEEGWSCQDDDLTEGIYRTCNYAPLEPGNYWKYTTGDRVTLESDTTCTSGLSGVSFATSSFGYELIVENKEWGLRSGCSYKMPERTQEDYGVNYTLIGREMRVGQTVNRNYFLGYMRIATTLVGPEQVTVPSGTYDSLKYEIVVDDRNPSAPCKYTTTLWLVKDLGPVRILRSNDEPSGCRGCLLNCHPDDDYTVVNTPAELVEAQVNGIRY